ncbi:MAG: type II toxin-antitoxin system HicA family toxin [Thermoplasmata archaeon]|nr:type II toxin-antitoxin system HicA family toxin [Thermoplasmata archaeon]
MAKKNNRIISCFLDYEIPCNHFGFSISGQKGSHVRLSKTSPEGKVGTVVPLHKEVKIGTLKGVLKLGKVDRNDFKKYL